MIKKLLLFLFCLNLCSLTVSANSGPTHWEGSDVNGIVIIDEDCPIEVLREKLTLTINQFPEFSYNTYEDYLNYDAHVTAQYTFYNPEDYTITVKCLFPIGKIGHYGSYYDPYTDTYYELGNPSQYEILVDNQAVDVQLRHSYGSPYGSFEWESEKAKLHDNYLEDDFFSPDLKVTRHTYEIEGVNFGFFDAAMGAFEVPKTLTETKIAYSFFDSIQENEDTIQAGTFLKGVHEIELYIIGQPIEELNWTVYKNGGMNETIDGTIRLKSTQTMTFEEFVFMKYNPDSQILKHDWYNIMVSQFSSSNDQTIREYNLPESTTCINWYEYEMTIEPHTSVVNTVTAPLLPEITTKYEPHLYTYNYLLSPAKNWKSFQNLDIEIKTNFYLSDPSLEGFEKTETGYVLSLENLPDEELSFTLCEVKNPKLKTNPTSIILVIIPWIFIGFQILLIVGFMQFFRKSKI